MRDESFDLEEAWNIFLVQDLVARIDALLAFVLVVVFVGLLVGFRKSRIDRILDTLLELLAES